MSIDLKYLLILQGLRAVTGGIFDEFFNGLSKFAVDILPFLPYVIFWCCDKKWGYKFMVITRLGELLNGIIKLTVCAYRPWIRSELIIPAGDSKVAATGYSFPSGHTLAATTNLGTVAVWQKDKRRWLTVVCVILVLLIGFSRNFLGVHTPQDVVVAMIESMIVIFAVSKVQKKVEGNEKVFDILTLAGLAFTAAALVYIYVKPYPMDFVDGVLLVDPKSMMNDSFKAAGYFAGLMIGSYVERHYIRYEIPYGSPNLGILSCVGAAIMITWKEYLGPATVVLAFGKHWGNFVARFLLTIFATVVWPLVIRKECGTSPADTETEETAA